MTFCIPCSTGRWVVCPGIPVCATPLLLNKLTKCRCSDCITAVRGFFTVLLSMTVVFLACASQAPDFSHIQRLQDRALSKFTQVHRLTVSYLPAVTRSHSQLSHTSQDVLELGEGYPEGAPLLSLLAIPSAPVPEEAEHLPADTTPATFPLEVTDLPCHSPPRLAVW